MNRFRKAGNRLLGSLKVTNTDSDGQVRQTYSYSVPSPHRLLHNSSTGSMALRFPVCLLWNWVQFWARCLANEFHLKFQYTLPTNTLGICLLKSLQGYNAHCINWFKFKLLAYHFFAICWNADLFLRNYSFRSMILVWGNLFPVYDPGSLLSICFRYMIVVLVENLFSVYNLVLFWVSASGIWILVLVGQSVSGL